MATNKQIISELNYKIQLITMSIQYEYPLHYQQLNETPLFLSGDEHIHISDLRQYLETITEQLKSFRSNTALHV